MRGAEPGLEGVCSAGTNPETCLGAMLVELYVRCHQEFPVANRVLQYLCVMKSVHPQPATTVRYRIIDAHSAEVTISS
jgi:hypothetical protein